MYVCIHIVWVQWRTKRLMWIKYYGREPERVTVAIKTKNNNGVVKKKKGLKKTCDTQQKYEVSSLQFVKL